MLRSQCANGANINVGRRSELCGNGALVLRTVFPDCGTPLVDNANFKSGVQGGKEQDEEPAHRSASNDKGRVPLA